MKCVEYSELIPGKSYKIEESILRCICKEEGYSVYSVFEWVSGANNFFYSADGYIRFSYSGHFSWVEVPFKFGRK